MRQQHVAEKQTVTQFSVPVRLTPPTTHPQYLRVIAPLSCGEGFLIVGPFNTPEQRETYKRGLLNSVPTIRSQLDLPRNVPFPIEFEEFESAAKPENVLGTSVANCREYLKAGYWNLHPEYEH